MNPSVTGTSGASSAAIGPSDASSGVPGPSDASGATGGAAAPGRVVLLTTSHRVAPGLLSWPAWRALHAADRVLCADPDHPQLPYLREAGVAVEHAAPTAEELVDACASGATVVVVATGEGEPRLTDGLARLAGSGRVRMPDLELLPASYDLPGARLLDLVQVMDRIRAECPWSSRQTHRGLAKYAIEEAYELVEAIEDGDRAELREELGDVLLQVVFHARIAEEGPEDDGETVGEEVGEDVGESDSEDGGEGDGAFSIDDVAAGIVAKLIHRHPHVFGEDTAETPEDVREHWLRTKAEEKRRTSVTEGVPLGQPGLALAAKLASRARTAGLDVPLPSGDDPRHPNGTGGGYGTGDGNGGVGYELLALAVRAERHGIDPEAALRAAARAYRDAIRAAERERGQQV